MTIPTATGDAHPKVSGVGLRVAPRPIAQPPVDPVSHRAVGRPPGFAGLFMSTEKYWDQHEYSSGDIVPDPVLVGAFGRPYAAAESPQRNPIDAGRFDGKRDGVIGDVVDDPWRDPGAIAAVDAPTLKEPPRASVSPATSKLGVRGVLFGGKVPHVSLAISAIVALLIGFTGGCIGRTTAEVIEAFTTSKVTL